MSKIFLYSFSLLIIFNNTYSISFDNDINKIEQNNSEDIEQDINKDKDITNTKYNKFSDNNKKLLPEQIGHESNTEYCNEYHVYKQKPMQMSNNNTTPNNNITEFPQNKQNSNRQFLISNLLQEIHTIKSEIQKNNLLLQELQKTINKQQSIINKHSKKGTEQINKVFNKLQNTKLVVIQHSDGTSTVTSRSKLNVPIKKHSGEDQTIVPTNIIAHESI